MHADIFPFTIFRYAPSLEDGLSTLKFFEAMIESGFFSSMFMLPLYRNHSKSIEKPTANRLSSRFLTYMIVRDTSTSISTRAVNWLIDLFD